MKYCKIWGMAIFAVGTAVGAIGAPPQGKYQLYGRILGGNTDWRAEAAVAFEASEPGIIDNLRINVPMTPRLRGDLYSLRFKLATEMNVDNGLVDSMRGTQVHLKRISSLSKEYPNVPYEAECIVDRKSNYNFSSIGPGIYTLSFTVAQPGIMSDEKRINHYSFELYVMDAKTELNIFCWDIFVPVKGKVLDPTGNPVVGARVRAFREAVNPGGGTFSILSPYPKSQEAWETQTDDNGCYTLNLPSCYPFEYALFQKNHLSELPFKYIVAATAPEYEIGSTPQFYPINDEVRRVGDVMANDLSDGPLKLDEEFAWRFILPEENLILQCPDIRLRPIDPNANPDIKQWRLRNAYTIFSDISL